MLSNTGLNNISIDNYKREILQIFMSAFCLFFKSPLTLVYLEVIANICMVSSG